MFKISIIVPVYKVEEYLPQCIESILSQTHTDFELLLVDDGSLDRCGAICDDYAKCDTRIVVFHTDNRGVAAARSLGLANAIGDYISFVDSDDWIEPDMLQKSLALLLHFQTDISVCGIAEEYQNTTKLPKRIENDFLTAAEAEVELCYDGQLSPYLCGKLFKKELLQEIILNNGLSFGEDFIAVYQLTVRSNGVSFAGQTGYHYRQRMSGAVSLSSVRNRKDFFEQERLILTRMEEQSSTAIPAATYKAASTALNILTICSPQDYREISVFLRKQCKSMLQDKRVSAPFKLKLMLSLTGKTTYQLVSRCFKRRYKKNVSFR